MKQPWWFGVPAGPAETWKDRAREAAEQARPADATDAEIDHVIEKYVQHGIPEADAATVKVEQLEEV